MALSDNKLRQVMLGAGDIYDISARYLHKEDGTDYTIEEILSAISQGLQIVIDEQATGKEEPKTVASEETMGKLYLVQIAGSAAGTYTEFITVKGGTKEVPTYNWEKIGTTAADLTDYLKKDVTYNSAALENGEHIHMVTGSVTVPTISKTNKTLGISRATDVAISGDGTANAITELETSPTKNALGAEATFEGTASVTSKYVGATASGTAVGPNGQADVVTGYSDIEKANAVAAGAGVNITGELTKTGLIAEATTPALMFGYEKAVKSYPGVTSKLTTSTITPAVSNGQASKVTLGAELSASKVTIGSDESAASKVTATAGQAASWGATVDNSGVLSFNWTTNTPTAVTVKDVDIPTISANDVSIPNVTNVTPIDVAKAGTDVSYATGAISDSSTGASILTGLGTAVTFDAATGGTLTSDIEVTLNTVESSLGDVVVATNKGTLGAAIDSSAIVNVVKDLGDPDTENVLTGVKVTSQPSVAVFTSDVSDPTYAKVVTDVDEMVDVTVTNADTATTISGVTAKSTATVLTGVKVTTQPGFELNGNASTGVSYVDSVTIGTETANLDNGQAAKDGAHTHDIKVNKQ